MYATPCSGSVPASSTFTTLGCSTRPRVCASRRNRSGTDGLVPSSSRSTFTATRAPSGTAVASNTALCPPRPITRPRA
jgi:hypothetical protein